MLHIPILRKGRPYRSMDVTRTVHYRTREPFVEMSMANVGLIRREMRDTGEARRILEGFSVGELMEMSAKAARHFLNDALALGDGSQTPQDYVEQLSATTGMPHVLARRNMAKIESVLKNLPTVLGGLTRGLDLSVLDRGYGEAGGSAISFFPRGESLGVVLPNNSPGVHSLWVPAIALKTPLMLKPGSAEPWTPYRILQAFIKAGVPGEVFGYFPADHAGGNEILRSCGRGMVFGDVGSTKVWLSDPRIEVHGPGYSKVVLGEDCVDEYEKYLDVIVHSISENGGRSCVNASGVWVPRRGREIAQALAERLAAIRPRAEDDPEAQIAPFADPNVGRRVSMMVDQDLAGAEDVTAKIRGDRVAEWNGCVYVLPTVVWCESPQHPLANREFLFPYASVVEAPLEEMPEVLGPSLVVTAITQDKALIGRMLSSPHVGRLNIGPISTMKLSWDQPHEGNLFEHLYARRAFQAEMAAVV
ncbi:MAG: aldehyde dehydrogenase family protein [Bryobacteraceae bacterium]|nr:aldehyde dehydrogenase family protein [Bryobacteraceae bacterium]